MTTTPTRSAREIAPLTGIRGLAALIVMLGHAELWSGAGTHSFPAQVAVDLFFVLSGFVISLTYLGPGGRGVSDWKGYGLARFARIYPLHLATALALGGMGVLMALHNGQPLPNATFNVGQAVQEVLLIAPLPIIGSDTVWNNPSWSIGVEWWVYFTLFPVLALVGWRLPARWAALFALLVLAAVAIWLTLEPDARETRGWPALARGMAGFFAGWATWRMVSAREGWMPPSWLAGALGLIVLAVAFAFARLSAEPPWFCLPLLALLIFALASNPGGAGRFLSLPPLLWLGDISYSVYMLHVPVLLLMQRVGGEGPALGGPLVWMVICVSASLLLGQLSYRLFERPAQRLIRGLRRGPVG
jgi:peptidoglycan/LPS O-acetylase OafA/YrhL